MRELSSGSGRFMQSYASFAGWQRREATARLAGPQGKTVQLSLSADPQWGGQQEW